MSDHTFTVGERVAVIGPYGEGVREIAKIDRITPSGQVVIGQSKYRPNGNAVGGSYGSSEIAPLTPELTRELFRKRAVGRIRAAGEAQLSALTDDDLRAIVAILDRAKSQEK